MFFCISSDYDMKSTLETVLTQIVYNIKFPKKKEFNEIYWEHHTSECIPESISQSKDSKSIFQRCQNV